MVKRIGTLSLLLLCSVLAFAAVGCAPMVPDPYVYRTAGEFGSAGTAAGQFAQPSGVAVDSAGNVYVADSHNHRIQKFSPTGTHILSWGTLGAGPGQFTYPRGVAVDSAGNVYVADTNNHRIQKFSSAGVHALSWGTEGSGAGQFTYPRGVAVDVDGNVYVADTNNHRIQKFSSAGVHALSWGTEGSEPGQFSSPSGVAVDAGSDSVYVADTGNGRVQRLSSTGDYVGSWADLGEEFGSIDQPMSVAVDGSMNIYVADAGGHRIVKLAILPWNEPVVVWGGEGTSIGRFQSPGGVALASGDVYVADTDNNRIQRFAPTAGVAYVDGPDRYATAVAASKKAYPEGAGTALIATGLNWPDALGGSALAGAHDGPILLTRPTALPDSVLAEIRRLEAGKAIILGGTSAVSSGVEAALISELGNGNVTRVGGQNRYETANLIAAAAVKQRGAVFENHSTAFVATGENFPDALAASPIAAARGVPIYLASRGGLSPATKAAMVSAGVKEVVVLGRSGAVSDAVERELKNTFGEENVDRVGGENRYATAVLVAQGGVDRAKLSWYKFAVATGEDFPDALAGGVLQGRDLSVLVLTKRNQLPAEVEASLVANKEIVREMRVLGGQNAVHQDVRNRVWLALQ